LSPALRRFVEEQVNTGGYLDAGDVVREALRRMEAQSVSYALLGGLGDGDIMAQAFIVMMEAAKSAQEDLKAIMDGVRAINEAKARLRKVQDQVNRDVAANAAKAREDAGLDFSNGMGSERAYHRVALPRLDPDAPKRGAHGGDRPAPSQGNN
jgi:putative addiction module CopG family antidote